MAGMFDLTPEAVPAINAQADSAQAMQLAQLQPGRGPVYAGALAGNMLGRGIGSSLGYQDPLTLRAERMQSAMRDTQNSGLDFQTNPIGYVSLAAKNLAKYGLHDAAFAALDKLKEIQQGQDFQAQAAQRNQAVQQQTDAQKEIAFIMQHAPDEQTALNAMVHSANPFVSERGQKLREGKYLVVPQDSMGVLDKNTGQYINGATNPRPWAHKGDNADQDFINELLYLKDKVQSGKATNTDLERSKVLYYQLTHVVPFGGGAAVDKGQDPALNPENWMLQAPPGAQAPTQAPSPQGQSSAPVQSPAVAYGNGRTSPSTVQLGPGTTIKPGIFQGPEGQARLDDQVKHMGETVIKNYVPTLDRAFSNVQALLKSYPEGETPGLGGAWNSPLAGYIMSFGQKFGDKETKKEMLEARDNRTSIIAVSNYIIRIMAGLNQTQGESARIMMEQATGIDATERDFRNAFEKLLYMYKDTRKAVLGAYPTEVRQKYSKQSGLNFNDLDNLPPPTMKTIPRTSRKGPPGNVSAPADVETKPSAAQEVPLQAVEYKPDGKVVETFRDGHTYTWPTRATYENWQKAQENNGR